jgi:hypothetical protein
VSIGRNGRKIIDLNLTVNKTPENNRVNKTTIVQQQQKETKKTKEENLA